MRRLRAEPVGIVVVSLGVAAMGFLLPALATGRPPELWPALSAAAGLPSLVLGVVLLWLRPNNRTGLLLALAGMVALLLAGIDNYLQAAQVLQPRRRVAAQRLALPVVVEQYEAGEGDRDYEGCGQQDLVAELEIFGHG